MKHRIALICASNQNRSMEAHNLFLEQSFAHISSFGTNGRVKLPGPAPDKPLVYEFGVSYERIREDLLASDAELYTQKGLIQMLERNMRVKPKPERFQETKKQFDIIITFEERVMDIVLEDPVVYQPVHVFNLDVIDSHEGAAAGARDAHALAMLIDRRGDEWEDKMDEIIEEFTASMKQRLLHSICFY